MQSVETLTQQERVVLHLVAQGWRSARIASELVVSRRTVENHLYHIFNKFGVSSRTEAVLYAVRSGVLSLDMSKTAQDERASFS